MANRSGELAFAPSPQSTVGVELELQILDRETGDLAPGAVRLLKACAEDGIQGPTAELMQSMIEVRTGVCNNVREVRQQLIPLLRDVRNIARSLGYELGFAGTHPFHKPTNSVVFPDDRYLRIQDRLVWLVSQRVVFGLHVHVGVSTGDEALGTMNLLVRYLPHLLALAANSPFWQGIDTGLSSSRVALYRLLPHAGVPRCFARWKDFRTYYRILRECETIASPKDIYWDIRPRPEYGTVEFRICDMPSTLATTLAVVALIRSLVISARRLLAERPQLQRGDVRRNWLAVENKWLATRHGLGATYIRTPAGKRRKLADEVAELLHRMMPIARETGDDVFLAAVQPVEKFETGAARQRRRYREAGNWTPLIQDMTRPFSELDPAPPLRLVPVGP